MPTVQVSPASGFGGVVQGSFGTYQQASDGTFTVDVRDVPALLTHGFNYLANPQGSYQTPKAPIAGAAGQIVSSATLSNGTLAINNQPDVMRQVAMVTGNGTVALTGGNIAVTYTANDGLSHTDNFPVAQLANTTVTRFLSRGVVHISGPVITGVAGGNAPFVRLDTTAALAAPVSPNAVDYATVWEYEDNTLVTGGWTDSTTSIGCVTPLTAFNGTHTYGLFYTYVSPIT